MVLDNRIVLSQIKRKEIEWMPPSVQPLNTRPLKIQDKNTWSLQIKEQAIRLTRGTVNMVRTQK